MRTRLSKKLFAFLLGSLVVSIVIFFTEPKTEAVDTKQSEKRPASLQAKNNGQVTKSYDVKTTATASLPKLNTKIRSKDSNISETKRKQLGVKTNNKLTVLNGKKYIQNEQTVVQNGVHYKRSGSSFSLDLRRRPAIFAEDLNSTIDWWKAFTELTDDLNAVTKDYRCLHETSRGNWRDCNSYPYKAQSPCLVYSFGIDNDFRFDDAMATEGCEVHSFDPSMEVKEHKRKTGVHFHKIGIGSQNEDKFHPWRNEYTMNHENKTWTIRTLASIMSKLGHTNVRCDKRSLKCLSCCDENAKRSLDILKLDIEGYEWEVLGNIISNNLIPRIKQLQVEFHIFPNYPPRGEYVEVLAVYQALWKLAFKRYYSLVHQYHPNKDKTHLQADVAYVNTGYMTET